MIRPPYDGTPVVLMHLAIEPVSPAGGTFAACTGEPFRSAVEHPGVPTVLCPGCLTALHRGAPVHAVPDVEPDGVTLHCAAGHDLQLIVTGVADVASARVSAARVGWSSALNEATSTVVDFCGAHSPGPSSGATRAVFRELCPRCFRPLESGQPTMRDWPDGVVERHLVCPPPLWIYLCARCHRGIGEHEPSVLAAGAYTHVTCPAPRKDPHA